MPSPQVVTFQQALELVEALPENQQQNLIRVLQQRNVESRREALAASLQEARQEYASGEFTRGSVDDLMAELDG
jgi:hypothetical protein